MNSSTLWGLRSNEQWENCGARQQTGMNVNSVDKKAEGTGGLFEKSMGARAAGARVGTGVSGRCGCTGHVCASSTAAVGQQVNGKGK